MKKHTSELFHVPTQFPFTASEMGLDNYHQEVNIRVTFDFNLKILENQGMSRKPLKSFELLVCTQLATQKTNFDSCARELPKITCKTLHIKTYSM